MTGADVEVLLFGADVHQKNLYNKDKNMYDVLNLDSDSYTDDDRF